MSLNSIDERDEYDFDLDSSEIIIAGNKEFHETSENAGGNVYQIYKFPDGGYVYVKLSSCDAEAVAFFFKNKENLRIVAHVLNRAMVRAKMLLDQNTKFGGFTVSSTQNRRGMDDTSNALSIQWLQSIINAYGTPEFQKVAVEVESQSFHESIHGLTDRQTDEYAPLLSISHCVLQAIAIKLLLIPLVKLKWLITIATGLEVVAKEEEVLAAASIPDDPVSGAKVVEIGHKCMMPYVMTVERDAKCLSAHREKSRCTAATVLIMAEVKKSLSQGGTILLGIIGTTGRGKTDGKNQKATTGSRQKSRS